MSVDSLNVAIQDAGKQNKTRDRTGVGGSLAGRGHLYLPTYSTGSTAQRPRLLLHGSVPTTAVGAASVAEKEKGKELPRELYDKCRVKVCTRIM